MTTTTPSGSTVLLDVSAGIATITLNRPETGNLFDHAMTEAFREAAATVAADPAVRVVVLRGSGKAFCSGGDVEYFGAADDPAAALDGMATNLHAGLLLLTESAAPVVAVVRGAAFGAGLSLAAFADVVIAGSSAKFLGGYPGVGLTPDGGMTWNLTRKVGLTRATSLLFAGGMWRAGDALAAGLVSEVVEDDELEAAATARIEALAAGPTGAFAAIRRLLDEGTRRSFADHLDVEKAQIVAQATSPEGREGIEAFAARRTPRYAEIGTAS
ncbi:enoyl-CoA hydratase/isomerase family protein [Patulibacter minatonensis]|uniref:enoyl-CoA hydratase/isomerase family protein n=1 Tax=Patulibacter minatonensis TaxID=298163 RepID=UPI00047BF531|nr:enoyl-CoA hydratase-related protein [Patulibacter minatonensis]